jgi:hypothetical protein
VQPKDTLFNGIYNRLYTVQSSGADDVMLFEATNKSFCNKPKETEFKHIWRALAIIASGT